MVAAAFASCTTAVLFLLYLLLSSDFSYVYVYQHTSRDLDPVARGALNRSVGSLMFMLWCLTGAALLSRRWDVSALQLGVNSPMATISLHLSAFVRRVLAPDGLGFSPILQHPMMVFHPPTMLMGYAAAGLMFSAAVSSIRRKGAA
ncbi:MAG: hypothetical protein MAG715_00230 [Methanonatronarchaeales archaeon]|nr:hypothetical protein [Methanonatronarchaeales archaeon]